MSLEEFISPDEGAEGGGNAAEISEKFKESVKRASAGIKRTQKDEGRAKKYDFLLANFLVQIILKKEFDELHDSMFACLDSGMSSSFVLGIFSLVHEPISQEIRKISEKKYTKFIHSHSGEMQVFSDSHLPEVIKNRINFWVEDMIDVLSIDISHISKQKNLDLIDAQEILIITYMSHIFSFFLQENYLEISVRKSQDYCFFILAEIRKSLLRIDTEEV